MSRLFEATTSTSALVVHAKVNNPEMPMTGLMIFQCSSDGAICGHNIRYSTIA
jgi:hypothetical protein